MRLKHSPVLALLLTAGLLPDSSQAQLIDVGPGYVRTPFVRVQRRGGLRARVQAPFVDVGGRRRRSQYQQYPQTQQSQQYTDQQQPMPTPAENLAPQPEPTRTAPPPSIAETEATTLETQRERLVAAAQQLEQALRRVQHSQNWINYLQLPAMDDDPTLVSTGDEPPLREQLTALKSRFESTRQDPRYQPVAALPEFDQTERQLNRYIEMLADASSTAAGSPTASVHPPPRPTPPAETAAKQPQGPTPAPQYREVIIRQRSTPAPQLP